jgi:hypothetical protein
MIKASLHHGPWHGRLTDFCSLLLSYRKGRQDTRWVALFTWRRPIDVLGRIKLASSSVDPPRWHGASWCTADTWRWKLLIIFYFVTMLKCCHEYISKMVWADEALVHTNKTSWVRRFFLTVFFSFFLCFGFYCLFLFSFFLSFLIFLLFHVFFYFRLSVLSHLTYH